MVKLISVIICFIFGFFLISYSSSTSPEAITKYSNEEVSIEFNEKILIKEPGFDKPEQPYFATAISLVKFNKVKIQEGNIQQVIPGKDGYLSKMFILPYRSPEFVKEILGKITLMKKKHEQYVPFSMESSEKQTMGWRYQVGKLTFDHYMVFGKKYNYLFISSHYGSTGAIEKVIRIMSYNESLISYLNKN
ncbi:MAG: hypothetical protein GY714_18855 [Desulfobacterales bacterium]|nr:hypothetical protein [Desulfobacterales bacterium]MCP4160656.1 hypothetical protein [Deltaproteobacteria bacterium]